MHIRTGDPLVQPDPRGLRQRQDGAQQQLFPLRQVRQDILGRERRRGMLGGEAAEMIRETSGGSGRPQTRTRTRTCTRTRTRTYYARVMPTPCEYTMHVLLCRRGGGCGHDDVPA